MATTLTDQLSAGIISTINGTEKLSDAFKTMGRNVLLELQKIIVRLTVMRTIGGILGQFNFGAPADTPLAAGSPTLEGLGGFSLTTLKGNARGTAATTGMSIAGEAGPEAVIPLPGNRRVPVELFGGGGGGTTVNINTIDARSFDEYFRDSAGRQASFLGGIQADRFQSDRRIRGRYS